MSLKLTVLGAAAAMAWGGASMAGASECVTPGRDGRVTLDFLGVQDVTLVQALQATLDSAGVSFVMVGAQPSDIKVYASARAGSPAAPGKVVSAVNKNRPEDSEFVEEDEDSLPEPETKEAAAPFFPPGTREDAAAAALAPMVPPPGTGPAFADPLRPGAGMNAEAPAPPAFPARVQTMEEILNRMPASAPAAGEAPAPPPANTGAATMEEILARTQEKPKQ